ncbi:hypothetical protein ACQPWW_03385 [Micromonospora sp. CA-240977]|uniref:hypothetical protein n=1 Tax=Micromonospora sp. CA-240977 TaxID=3239957 RepID=UPI003D93E589
MAARRNSATAAPVMGHADQHVMSPLLGIYLVRGLVAIVWATGFSAGSDSLTAITVVLLIAHPLIDVVASRVAAPDVDPGPPWLVRFRSDRDAAALFRLGGVVVAGVASHRG